MKLETRFYLPILCALLYNLGCGGSTSGSGGTPIPAPVPMALSRTSAAAVPGGTAAITVTPASTASATTTYSATCTDPAVATASVTGTSVTITGLALGTCSVKVAGSDGSSDAMPVQVYDPKVMDTGELLVAITGSFTLQYDVAKDIGFKVWHPVVPSGFYALGDLWWPGAADPSGSAAVLAIKPKVSGSTATVLSTTFSQKGNCYGLDSLYPVPPPGYVALGRFGFDYRTNPSLCPYGICVRQDLTAPGALVGFWDLLAPDNLTHFFWWRIDQPSAGPHTGALLAPGTFAHQVKYGGNPVANADVANNVLKLNLPLLADAPERSFAPTLTSYDDPPAETPQTFAKAMLIPCTAITDATKTQAWQVANSPFYRLERAVFYKRLYHRYNQGSETSKDTVAMTAGATTSDSQTFSTKTGIQISAETGIQIGPLGAKVTATVSKEFGYETQTSVSELVEWTFNPEVPIPPHKAGALWQKYNRFTLYRHNGTVLEEVAHWDIGIPSYVTDEYPN